MKKFLHSIFQQAALLAALTLVITDPMTSHAATAAKPPTLIITSPKTKAKWSNELFMVTGSIKAGTRAISNVLVSVNSGAWAPATITSNTWNLQVDLTPGTNTIAAFANDVAGLTSKTNKVLLLYVVMSPLTLTINGGEGTVTGATNGQPLLENVSHTLTVKAATGFGFEFWSVGANSVTNSKLTFLMTPGLVIIAHFKDVSPPTLAITAPTANENDSNSTVTVIGTAADNLGVASVQVQINGGGWNTASGTTSWSAASLPVVVGNNTVQAYAVDGAGNVSKTNTVAFTGLTPSQTTWAPTSVIGKVIILTPVMPGPLPPHILSFNSTTFSYADTNRPADDSGVGNYDYQNVDTNFSVVQIAFTAPPTNNGVAANVDLNFTNFNIGTFSNALTGESGTFVIQDTPMLLPAKFSGLTFTVLPVGAVKASTVKFTSATNVTITQSTGSVSGTYTVFTADPVGAFLDLEFQGAGELGHIYFQITFTGANVGIYEVNDFLNGVFEKTDCGTFSD